ncbi:hypothetical protein [Coraliomargarita akajimensis]|uniref:PEP-CTERM protein-sorting domain-containing protein n=1 Tax=Coraliomargarita akajimensis (strain DSM 45221 / IAM 15411 / JCM 23193 / KCTC 12865 / 04OKA010-24) TaxID=583355 RepID=D5EPX2_CORAD|nr:hypothetical protein [Coraliomargarita akajimensis]ADE55705.1 hypothetical protein Caka_2690 [Coraliomargarita akajimensis DSM 45221]
MPIRPTKLSLLFLSFTYQATATGFITSSLEKYTYQIGDNAHALKSYDAFDEIDGVPEDGLTNYYLSVNGGSEADIPFSSFYGQWKRGINYASESALTAARPIGSTYTHRLYDSRDSFNETVTIGAPNTSLSDGLPSTPTFTINGLAGYWTTEASGIGRFNFDPSQTSSFTVTLNAYGATTRGGNYASGITVNEISDSFTNVGDTSTGVQLDSVAASTTTITFYIGAPSDNGDSDDTTYGISLGDTFELEGEHVNIFGLGAVASPELAGFEKAFIYQTVTGFELNAIPEPGHAGLIVGVSALLLANRRRRH